MTAANHVDRYRQAAKSLRGIRRNGGKTMATTFAEQRHAAAKSRAVLGLLDLDRGDLVGLLVDEESLALRLLDSDLPRPELSARLAAARKALRAVGTNP